MTITFYTNPNSRGRMVRWMLEEIGCPYDTVVLDYEPASKDDRWGGAALAQPDASDTDHRRARFFNDINPIGKIPAIDHRAGFAPLPEQEFFFGHGSYARTVRQLKWAVQAHPYIAGERFTAADVYVGSHIGWGLGLQTLPPHEAFIRYATKLTAREAYQRAVLKDNELLAQASR